MKEEKLVEIGKWLNTLGYDLNLKDDFWMEDFITDHKFRDLADLLDKYHTFKLNMHIVSRSIGNDIKPKLMTMTKEQKNKYKLGCELCIFDTEELDIHATCYECYTDNKIDQYYG